MKTSEVQEILAGAPDPDQVVAFAADARNGVPALVVANHKLQ